MIGKTGMVWRLREWQGGDPARQLAQALDLGLTSVSIKVADQDRVRWEGGLLRQNDDLLPDTVAALRSGGLGVGGWVWVVGRRETAPYASISLREADVAASQVRKYSLDYLQVDAEAAYKRTWLNIASEATVYMQRLTSVLDILISLCSYRYPDLHNSFPWDQFLAYSDHHSPQVYFLQATSPDAGAVQLEQSFEQLTARRPLPMTPIAPTYSAAGGWRASKEQLTRFFARSLDMALMGTGVWKVEGASVDQLAAIREFDWPIAPLPTEPPADALARLWRRALIEWPGV